MCASRLSFHATTISSIANSRWAVKLSHFFTRKVHEMGSLPQLRKVLETGGEATGLSEASPRPESGPYIILTDLILIGRLFFPILRVFA